MLPLASASQSPLNFLLHCCQGCELPLVAWVQYTICGSMFVLMFNCRVLEVIEWFMAPYSMQWVSDATVLGSVVCIAFPCWSVVLCVSVCVMLCVEPLCSVCLSSPQHVAHAGTIRQMSLNARYVCMCLCVDMYCSQDVCLYVFCVSSPTVFPNCHD